MKDSVETIVFETGLEVEANIYAELLIEAGVFAQVRAVEDPLLTNIIRQIALPRYQIIVSTTQIDQAKLIIAEQQQAVADDAFEEEEEEEPADNSTQKTTLLLIGRIFIWLLILAPIIYIFITQYQPQSWFR